MAAPLNTCTTIEERGVVRILWAKNMVAGKDNHKEMLPNGQNVFFGVHTCMSVHHKYISKVQPTRCKVFSIYLFL
jgi:hypothetical protein